MSYEVATAYLNIAPSIRGLQAEIEREMRGVNTRRAGQEAGDGYTSGFGGAAKKLTGVLAGAFAGAKAIDFGKDAIAQASDLNEVATKMQVVFGDANGAVQQFASQGAKALGLSSLEAQNAAANFGVFGKSAGLAGQDQADFSTGMAKLAVDMASFSNTTPEQAIEALSAGLRGESEPLRSYGVLLDDASLRQEALAQGLITTTKDALTPQQKVLASHALIMKQTADAQGDFGRTSGGLANQQRILSAQWTDMKGKLGAAFLPAVTSVVTALNDRLFPILDTVQGKISAFWTSFSTGDTSNSLVAGFEKLQAIAKELWPSIQSIAASVGQAVQSLGVSTWSIFLSVLESLQEPLKWVAKFFTENPSAVLALVAAFTAYKVITTTVRVAQLLLNAAMAANPIGLVVAALVALAAGLVWAYTNVGWFKDAVDAAWSFIKDATTALWEGVIKPAFNWIADNIHVVGDFFIAMWNAAQPVFDFLKASFENFLTVIQGVIDFVVGVFTGDWSRAWEGIKAIAGAVWDQIVAYVSLAWDLITGIGGKILDWLGAFAGWAWDRIVAIASTVVGWGLEFLSWLWDGIKTKAVEVLQWFADLPSTIWTQIENLSVAIVGYGWQFLQWLWDGITNLFPSVMQWFADLPSTVWTQIENLSVAIVGYGASFIGWIKDGIETGASAIWNWFTSLPTEIGKLIDKMLDKMKEFGGKIIGWIVDGITGAAKAVADAVTGLFDLKLNAEGTGFITANPLAPGAGGGIAGRMRPVAGGGVFPGYAPGVDNIHALLSPGEGVMVPEFVKMVGPQWVYTMNRLARGGRYVDPSRIMGPEQLFAGGGIVQNARKIGTDATNQLAGGIKAGTGAGFFSDIAKQIRESVAGALSPLGAAPAGARGAFMKAVASQMGLPYVWGGASPPSFDCSGLMSWALTQAGVGKGRLTAAQFGDNFPRVNPPKPGDMAIFDTGRVSPKAGHIGMVLDPAAGTMMHTDGAGPSRTSDYTRRGGLMGFIDAIGGSYSPPTGAGGLLAGVLDKLRAKRSLNNAVGPSPDGPAPVAGGVFPPMVERWRATVLQGLALISQPASLANTVLNQIRTESSGNPNAINLTDINAQRGYPSRGLVQTIPQTFAAYRLASLPNNIVDPLANIVSGMRYAIARYGSIPAGMRGVAYDTGGWLLPGMSGANLGPRPEAVLNPAQSDALITHARNLEAGYAGQAPVVLNINLDNSDPLQVAVAGMIRAGIDQDRIDLTFAAREMAGQSL